MTRHDRVSGTHTLAMFSAEVTEAGPLLRDNTASLTVDGLFNEFRLHLDVDKGLQQHSSIGSTTRPALWAAVGACARLAMSYTGCDRTTQTTPPRLWTSPPARPTSALLTDR